MDVEILITWVNDGDGCDLEDELVGAILKHRNEGDSTNRARLSELEAAATYYANVRFNRPHNYLGHEIAGLAVELLLEDDSLTFDTAGHMAGDQVLAQL